MKNFMKLGILFLLGVFLFSCSENIDNNNAPQKRNSVKNISSNEAIAIANNFIDAKGLFAKTRANSSLEIAYTDLDGQTASTRANNTNPAYYVVNVGNDGFIIVSGIDASAAILGYSNEGAFAKNDIPTNMSDVLANYKEQINYARNNNIKASEEILEMRKEELRSNTRTRTIVSPILGTIKWGQDPYYNAYCPKGCPVGCVATATSQIMRYWEYPTQGEGEHSYYHYDYEDQSFDYDYKIKWENMPKATLRNSNKEIAKFCYGVAVGVNMDFGPYGSGAYQSRVPSLLKNHYKYPNTVENEYRSSYSYKEWIAILKKELDAGRPIQYGGFGDEGGHSFVCDGYNSKNYFHFNWGWSGMSDGWFRTDALNPGSLGTGGGNGGFNNRQSIVIGFAPDKDNGDDNSDDDGNDNGDDNGDDDGDNNDNYDDKYPRSKAKFSTTAYIKHVEFANIDNQTTIEKKGYVYYGDKFIANITTDKEYALKLTSGFRFFPLKNYWRVWIDLNNDYKFSDDEMIAEGTTNGNNSLEKDIRINENITKNSNLRMRVSMSLVRYPEADKSFIHGEVEDYTVNLK